MAETLLRREFKESDVNRIRNLMTKKYGDATSTQVGYTKKTEDHSEGDIWEEDNKTWTIQNGIKQSYTKLSGIKALLRMPFSCPVCERPMKSHLDKKMYPIHGKCYDCVIEYESLLRAEGKYEDYVKDFITKNLLTDIKEAEQFIDHVAREMDEVIVSEAGDEETWEGGFDKDKMVEQWKKELKEMKETIHN